MKKNILKLLSATVFSVAIAVPNLVLADEDDDLCAQIQVEINIPGVCVSIKDGVATLSGVVESMSDKEEAARIAANAPGIEEVINLIVASN